MHDIDRTQAETTWEAGPFGAGNYEAEAYEGEWYGEADEMALAAELLEVSNEAELDQFLGSLFKKVSDTVGKAVKGPVGRALGGMIKPLAKSALPMLGGALGSVVPGLGTALGAAAGNAAGSMFGLELEGMSAEDQEYETARRVVRLATDAAKNAAALPPSAAASPQAAAKHALMTAARDHAPGLLNGSANGAAKAQGRTSQSGRWVRRGHTVVLLDMA